MCVLCSVFKQGHNHGRRKEGTGGKGPLDFEIIGKKKLFFQFPGLKTKFHHFWSPWKNFGKIPY